MNGLFKESTSTSSAKESASKSANSVDYGQMLDDFEALSDSDFIKNKKDGIIDRLSVKAAKNLIEMYENGDNISDCLNDFKNILDSAKRVKQENKNILKLFKDIYNYIINNTTSGKGLKILTPKQMLSRLPGLLAKIKAGNNSKTLKNEARQLIYSLYESKKISKKLYNIVTKRLRTTYK